MIWVGLCRILGYENKMCLEMEPIVKGNRKSHGFIRMAKQYVMSSEEVCFVTNNVKTVVD